MSVDTHVPPVQPEIGMGVTIQLFGHDRVAGTVMDMSGSGRSIRVREDLSIRIDGGRTREGQEYVHFPDPAGKVRIFRVSKKFGTWKSKSGITLYSLGKRDVFRYDQSIYVR